MPPASRAGRRGSEAPNCPWHLARIAISTVAVDAGTKAWAVHWLGAPSSVEPRVVWLGVHWRLELMWHRGGVWGWLDTAPQWLKVPLFLLVGLSTVVFVALLYFRTPIDQANARRGLALLLGGALGNLVDRIVWGQVVDFIDFRADWVGSIHRWVQGFAPSWQVTDHWPTFNVADVAICLGALSLLLGSRATVFPGKPKPISP